MRIAYEALAWGRHVNDYEHAWRIVERAASPGAGHLPGQLPHPLARHRPRGHPRDPGREALLPAARRRAAPAHGRAAVEPPPPLLPRPGRLRSARASSRHVLAAGYAGPLSLEVFNDVFRQADPRADGGRRDALAARCSRTSCRAARAAAAATPSPSWRRAPAASQPLLGTARLRPHRPPSHQAGAAVGAGRRRASGQRRARSRGVAARRGRERRPAGVGRARGGAARPGPRRRAARARPTCRGRRARRHRGVLLRAGRGLGGATSRAELPPRPTGALDPHRPPRARAAVRLLRRGGAVLPRRARRCEPRDSQELAAPDGLVRSRAVERRRRPARAQRPAARRRTAAAELQHVAFASRRRRRRRAAVRARPACRCWRSPATTTTTSRPGSASTRRELRELGAALRPRRARRRAPARLHRRRAAACSSRCVERRGGYAGYGAANSPVRMAAQARRRRG